MVARTTPAPDCKVLSVNPAGSGFPTVGPPYMKSGYYCTAMTVLIVIFGSILLFVPLLSAEAGAMVLVAVLSVLLGLPVLMLTLYLNSFATSNDWYTKILILSYKFLLFGRRVPTAKQDMAVRMIRPKRSLQLVPIKYAMNISVPKGSEEEFKPEQGQSSNVSLTSSLGVAFEENLYRLPQKIIWDRFAPGENCVQYAMSIVGDAYPVVNTVFKEKLTDKALTQFCFFGIGAHRLYREQMGDAEKGTPASGDYVVRTNQLATLPVREGLDSYGGDAYFDYETWRIKKIVRRFPAAPWDPPEAKERTFYPGDPEWEYVKFVFRSSLFSLVTLVDHLYGIHMQVGNFVTIAQREQLGANHPIRRFLAPFCYQTISVNDNARNNLVNPSSMGPRNFAFTDEGVAMAWAAAPSLITSGVELRSWLGDDAKAYLAMLLDYEKYIDYLRQNGIDTPYRRQSLDFWLSMKRFVEDYVRCYYKTQAELAEDKEIWRFVLSIMHDMAFTTAAHLAEGVGSGGMIDTPEELYFFLVNLLTRYCYVVTAAHEHVGTVSVYAQDVSFTAFNWPKDELCGTKQTAVTSATLMAFTSTPMPKLMAEPGSDGDWTHLFEGPLEINGRELGSAGVVPDEARSAFNSFQARLKVLSDKCDAFNEAAQSKEAEFPHCFGMWQTHPRHLETAVSV